MNQERDFGDQLNDSFRQLIESFERGLHDGDMLFLEESDFEDIIEYYLAEGDATSALKATEQGIIQHRFSGVMRVRRGQVLREMNKYAKAIEALDDAEAIDPGDIEIYLSKAEIFTEIGQHARAIEILCKAEEMFDKEDLADIFITMAEVYESWEKFDKAFAFLRKCLKADPNNDEALYRMWFIVNLTEKYEESVTLHEDIIDNNPYAHFAWYNLGQAYFGLGLFEKAAEAFEYVTLIHPTYEMAYRDWAEALYRCSAFSKAIEVLQHAVNAFQPDELVYFKLGLYTERIGESAKARKYYREVVKLDPYFGEAYVRTALIFRGEGQLEEAQRAMRKAIRINPENPNYQILMADISMDIGDLDAVTTAYRMVTALQPSVVEHWIGLVRCLVELKELGEALVSVDKAIEHRGPSAVLLYARCAILFALGSRPEALTELHMALAADTNALSILFELIPALQNDDEVTSAIHHHHHK